MADGVIYLDIDDEITSAAARIRQVEGRRVAVVLPYGSRVATSRINFRLLARDALTHEKRLSVLSGDAATRALAASAGIPVFASVQEYEATLEEGGGVSAGATLVSTTAAAAAPSSLSPPSDPVPAARARPTDAARTDAGADLEATAALAAVTGATTRTTQAPDAVASPTPSAGSRSDEPRVRPVTGARPMTAAGSGGRRVPRTPFLVAAVVLALVAVVGGVGAYLLLPSAEVTITSREQSVGPIAFSVVASPEVDAPDIEAGIVPALTVPLEVDAADTFEATGERVEETAATGAVRFDNLDPTSSNSIAKGAVVSTNGGIRFRTDRAITIPAARLVGFQIVPASASVAVTAVDPGPDGNVQPNAVITVPRGEEPIFLKVTNPDETTGGVSESFPRVTQEDVDAALVALAGTLQVDLQAKLDGGDLAPVDVTVFTETATLGDPTWSVGPETLVGQEIETFDLSASASGSVLGVDTAPLEAIAAARLTASIDPGYVLVDDSSEVQVDPAVIDGSRITFPVRVTATEVAILDPDAIAAAIRGLPLADAQAILDGYGSATVAVWPEWVSTIPTIDGRLTVTVEGPTP